MLVDNADFREEESELRFSLGELAVLNVGQSDRALFVSTNENAKTANVDVTPTTQEVGTVQVTESATAIGQPGDRQFVDALREMPETIRQAGTEILRQVRQDFPGDLRPYPRRRFFETPDNFWGVEIQVRLKMLKFSVRGVPERFDSRKLEVRLDRPPSYSGFKVAVPQDVAEAVRIIRHADRKGH